MTAVRPDIYVALICGSISISAAAFDSRLDACRRALARGQLPSHLDYSDGIHQHKVELISDGWKYEIAVTRTGPHTFVVALNDSHVDVELHALPDGGRLVLFGGRSHVTYLTEEVRVLFICSPTEFIRS